MYHYYWVGRACMSKQFLLLLLLAHQEALKKEIERLREIYHHQNLKKMSNQNAAQPRQPPTSDPLGCTNTQQLINWGWESSGARACENQITYCYCSCILLTGVFTWYLFPLVCLCGTSLTSFLRFKGLGMDTWFS